MRRVMVRGFRFDSHQALENVVLQSVSGPVAEIAMSEPEKSAFRKKFEELSDRFRNPKDRKTQINIWYIVFAFLGLTLAQSFYQASKQYTTIPYSQFQTLLDQDKIDQVWIEQNTIQGT